MIDETQGTASARKKLSDALVRILTLFPLAGFTILGRSVYVRIEKGLRAPGLAYIGGIKLDEDALLSWTRDEATYLLLHEWMHIFGNHVLRCGDRDPTRWGIAADYRVNTDVSRILKWQGDPPRGGLVPPDWVGDLTPEQIYDRLPTGQEGKAKKPPPKAGGDLSTPDMVAEVLIDPSFEGDVDQFRDVMVTELCAGEAALTSMNVNLREVLGDYIAQRLVDLKRGVIPWGRLLTGDMMSRLSGQRATYAPPRRRLYPYIILPSYRDSTSRSLLLGIDVSASITKSLMNEFASSCAAAATRANKTTVVTFDQVVRERFETRSPHGVLSNLQFTTGAHNKTDVRPVFEIADEIKPSAIAILTDGYIHLPKKAYPGTLWAIPRGGALPPWGRHYTMEVSW